MFERVRVGHDGETATDTHATTDLALRTYLLEIAYHGAAYAGWQRQEGHDSVQARLEGALQTVLGERVVAHGAGRTDAGVHALRQCAHVRSSRSMLTDELCRALNGNLPQDVCVRRVREVIPDFHARFSALGKRYVYRVVVSRLRPVHARGLTHWVKRPVDLDAMRRAARSLIGRHDFAAFATNPGYQRKHGTVRHLQRLHVVRRPHGFDLFVQGDGFLYNMVRTVAGTLIEVGTGRRRPEEVGEILASRDRRRAGVNAPACGLFLLRVLYPRRVFRFGGPVLRDAARRMPASPFDLSMIERVTDQSRKVSVDEHPS